jgi:mono/diheme cytochrome c family protein
MRISARLISCILGLFVLSSAMALQAQSNWQIPASAKTEKSPLKATPDVLKKGRGIFTSRCQKCHGNQGKGDGPDADSKAKPADLTASKAEDNPDGVMYYKVANGQPPKMPAFKGLMSRDEIWTVVEYAKSLRQGQ